MTFFVFITEPHLKYPAEKTKLKTNLTRKDFEPSMIVESSSWQPPTHEALPAAVALAARSNNGEEQIFCSGVPLRRDLILTAAHCIQEFRNHWPEQTLVVRAEPGETNTFSVNRWFVHPLFQPTLKANAFDVDIALLSLETSLPEKQTTSEKLPASSERQTQTLWMKGYSPIRLKTESARTILSTSASWSPLRFEQELASEGKMHLSSGSAQVAPCSGDSGAPVWNFENQTRELKAIVVQGNCAGGKANAVSVRSLSRWIQDTTDTLNEHRSTLQALWKIFPRRLFAADRN